MCSLIIDQAIADRYDTNALFGYTASGQEVVPAGGGSGGPDAGRPQPASPPATPAGGARKPPASGDCQDPTQQVPAPTVNP
ncbi:hypothetical protein ACXO8T_09395 [Lactobacillus delbrueckii subsp. bulgaricus]